MTERLGVAAKNNSMKEIWGFLKSVRNNNKRRRDGNDH